MLIKIKIISIVLLSALVFSGCTCLGYIWGNYNQIMIDHLSNPNNYENYQMIINDLLSAEEVVSNDHLTNKELFISDYVIADSEESLYLGAAMRIFPTNVQILYDNGFFDHYVIGDTVEICTSEFYYGDTAFYIIIGVNYNGKEYLNSELALNNVIEYMEANRSLL